MVIAYRKMAQTACNKPFLTRFRTKRYSKGTFIICAVLYNKIRFQPTQQETTFTMQTSSSYFSGLSHVQSYVETINNETQEDRKINGQWQLLPLGVLVNSKNNDINPDTADNALVKGFTSTVRENNESKFQTFYQSNDGADTFKSVFTATLTTLYSLSQTLREKYNSSQDFLKAHITNLITAAEQ